MIVLQKIHYITRDDEGHYLICLINIPFGTRSVLSLMRIIANVAILPLKSNFVSIMYLCAEALCQNPRPY
jgi:hypothetical protein